MNAEDGEGAEENDERCSSLNDDRRPWAPVPVCRFPKLWLRTGIVGDDRGNEVEGEAEEEDNVNGAGGDWEDGEEELGGDEGGGETEMAISDEDGGLDNNAGADDDWGTD